MSAAPVVGIVMGSDSDWPVMQAAAGALAELDVPGDRAVAELLLESLEGLLLGALLIWLSFARGWLTRPGMICGIFIAGYGLSRFIIEFFREADSQFITLDNPLGHVIRLGELGVSMGQLLSLPMILTGLVILVIAARKRT